MPMIVAGHGQIAQMTLPPGWAEVPQGEQIGLAGVRSVREFKPGAQCEATLCLFFRGEPVDFYAGQQFVAVLKEPPHVLTLQQWELLVDVLGTTSDPKAFQLDEAQTLDLNGKRVLVVEGIWAVYQHKSYQIYVDVDGSGRFIQEIYFIGPKEQFEQYRSLAKQAIDSIVWQ
ncbi:MAG: hypothetical protein HY711_00440 [Candidatus Melainabacteria bacterium]|nr:hypothetical protein [Candidatus Melainabacteria bacterium]